MKVSFDDFLNESIDIYPLEDVKNDLDKLDIHVNEFVDKKEQFKVNFEIRAHYYTFYVWKSRVSKTEVDYAVVFGDTDDFGDNINTSSLLNRDISRYILSIIFSLLRYWVDKY